ncbi:uncharacterized protein LOC107046731, partial [Diachasma alloeum]|uniref:uncharacterized protein LOC107046731 n=1 Tax=Diachasma alloeum TaxID=454923 RepID=UPI000738172B
AATTQARLHEFLQGSNVRESHPVPWTTEGEAAFNASKKQLQDATLLVYPDTSLPWAVFTDASEFAIGAVLQQRRGTVWEPLAFFSKKLQPSLRKRCPYDRELHAIYEAVRKFRHIFEGRHVTIYTDHKPLLHAFKQNPDKANPWQFHRLDFIGQFSTDIQHVAGKDNVVADALSRIEAISTAISTAELAQTQAADAELQERLQDPNGVLQLRPINMPESPTPIYCDVNDQLIRPYVPLPLHFHVSQKHSRFPTLPLRLLPVCSTQTGFVVMAFHFGSRQIKGHNSRANSSTLSLEVQAADIFARRHFTRKLTAWWNVYIAKSKQQYGVTRVLIG